MPTLLPTQATAPPLRPPFIGGHRGGLEPIPVTQIAQILYSYLCLAEIAVRIATLIPSGVCEKSQKEKCHFSV